MECYEPTATDPSPHPTAPLEVQELKELGVKLSPGKKGKVEGIWFFFKFFFLILIILFCLVIT